MGISPRPGDGTQTRGWHPEEAVSPHRGGVPVPLTPLSRCRSNASWISRRGEPCATSWQPPINSRATKDGEHPPAPIGVGVLGGCPGGTGVGVPSMGTPWGGLGLGVPEVGWLWGCHLQSKRALGRVPLCHHRPCWGPGSPPPPSPNFGVLTRRPELWLS